MTDRNKYDEFFKPQTEPAPPTNDYQAEQLAIQRNRERLKAERLAREQSTP